MKKSIFALFIAITMSMTALAGQVNWDAGDFSSTFASGTGYLIQVTSGTTSSSAIAEYISKNGLAYSGVDVTFKQWGTGTITEDSGSYYIDSTVITGIASGTYNNLFVIVLSDDKILRFTIHLRMSLSVMLRL